MKAHYSYGKVRLLNIVLFFINMITFVYFLKEITQTEEYRDWSECSPAGASPDIIF